MEGPGSLSKVGAKQVISLAFDGLTPYKNLGLCDGDLSRSACVESATGENLLLLPVLH